MQIIAVDLDPASDGGRRIYPVMADKDGRQVWPKKAIEQPDPIGRVHAFVDQNSPAYNDCLICGFLKDDPIHEV
jgi:hypothetical protein